MGQGIARPRDQLCNILGMRRSGVFNEGWCLLEGEEGEGVVMRLGAGPPIPQIMHKAQVNINKYHFKKASIKQLLLQ